MPNRVDPRRRDRLVEGLVVPVEPIVTAGAVRGPATDGWALPTVDGALPAHVEHTIVVRRGRPLVLTRLAPPGRPIRARA